MNIAVLTCSVKDGTYVEDPTLIAQGQAAGTIHVKFDPVLAPFIKIKVIENNTGAITGATVWLSIT